MSGKLIMYMFDNSNVKSIDYILIKNKDVSKVRTIDDITIQSGLLKNNINNIKDGIMLYPLIITDINIYDVNIFLKKFYSYIYKVIAGLFLKIFKESDKYKSYIKNDIITIKNITNELRTDEILRKNVNYFVKNTDYYIFAKSLENIVIGGIDVTYYFVFYQQSNKYYPCYLYIDSIKETDKEININFNIKISNDYLVDSLSHNIISNIFKKVLLASKSFNNFNFNDMNIKQNVSYIPYDAIDTIKNIIEGYNLFFK